MNYIRDTMDLTEDQVKHLEEVFRRNLPKNKECLTLTEFKKLMPSKNVSFNTCSYISSNGFQLYFSNYFQIFFVERVFNIFDQDGSGEISLAEFLDTMYKFAGKDPTNKLLFLFKVYDIDGRYYGIMRRRMEFTSKMY